MAGTAMTFDFIEWDEPGDDPSNVDHIAEHGVTPGEVEDVLSSVPDSRVFRSRSSGRLAVISDTAEGRTLFVTFERRKDRGDIAIYPVTAFDHQG
jgi:uncharacterized DUF497 family protein